MKVIVAGGREFADYELLFKKLDVYLCISRYMEFVFGGARGGDGLGAYYARVGG